MPWDYSHGTTTPRWVGPMPMTVPTLTDQVAHGHLREVAAGGSGGYALTADGHIVAFGNDEHEQSLDLPTAGGFVQVSAGQRHGYALTADGHIVAFGTNDYLQRGDLPATGGFVQVSAGGNHGYALTADGHIVAFGQDVYQRRDLPATGGFVQVSSGDNHGYALTADGHIVAFGRWLPHHGAVRPPASPPEGGFQRVSSGGNGNGYALTADGHIVAFGNDEDEQSLDLPATGGFVQVVGGGNHGYALTADGHIVAFGQTKLNEPRRDLPATGGFVQVVGGNFHGYALTADGHIVAFGSLYAWERRGLPLFPAWFSGHPFIEDATRTVQAHVVPDDPATLVPFVIVWGDGTPDTPVPVGTTVTDTFPHTYADGSDHTLRLRSTVSTAHYLDTATAHFDPSATGAGAGTGTGTTGPRLYVFTWDGKAFQPATLMAYDGTKWV